MHTFRLRVIAKIKPVMTPKDQEDEDEYVSTDTVDKVKQLLKETLKKDFNNSNRVLKERMDHNLVNIFGSDAHFHLSVDAIRMRSSTPERKSFFVNIMVKDKKHISITAEY
eukprot:GFUD01139019.1.p1 GENE.GFUD01139019.1~~GFUD01139019.1.p1  ORF type:complete len:111 (+),score=33.61 GFUD01139019.1:33-365(+)